MTVDSRTSYSYTNDDYVQYMITHSPFFYFARTTSHFYVPNVFHKPFIFRGSVDTGNINPPNNGYSIGPPSPTFMCAPPFWRLVQKGRHWQSLRCENGSSRTLDTVSGSSGAIDCYVFSGGGKIDLCGLR